MIIYIAGPMAGIEDNNKKAFYSMQYALEDKGHTVLNPAILPDGLPATAYMPICLAMLEQCDAIILLKNWASSAGANIELDYAQYQNKKVYFNLFDLQTEVDGDAAKGTD